MKKLLLVLLVVAIASFLFVGCLPVTPSEGEGEGEGEGEVEVAITFDREYTNAGGQTFVACGSEVAVTFPSPVAIDYVVYLALKYDDGEYDCMTALTPNADRTIWTLEDYAEGDECDPDIDECEPFCVVALVKHPCCPGEEVALRVVSLDCTPPYADIYVTFYDCGDPCEEPDPCNPPVPGAYAEWTSRTFDGCESTDCCGDDCSGLASWSVEVGPDPCEGPCDLISGTTCPVEGILDCGCLPYPETDTSEIIVVWTLTDNVGNSLTGEVSVILDTDEVIEIAGESVTMGVAVPVFTGSCK